MGLAVKTDGAAVAAGGITESLILAKNAAEGVNYQPGWILGTAATIKVFIDIFIGIWAFVLGYIWTNHINVTPDQDKAKAWEIWQRFPKFIIGFVITFAVGLYLALGTPADIAKKVPAAIGEANTFRVIFFILTFFSIGVLSNFKTLWQEGLRQARRGLSSQPVRLCHLGRTLDLLDVLRRHHAAAGELEACSALPAQPAVNGMDALYVSDQHSRRIEPRADRAAAADREEADRLEPRPSGSCFSSRLALLNHFAPGDILRILVARWRAARGMHWRVPTRHCRMIGSKAGFYLTCQTRRTDHERTSSLAE